jgi:predicted naringenin-chalcone synthase
VRAKIISLGCAVPSCSYSQEEIFQELGYPHHFWRIFKASGIDRRYFCTTLAKLRQLSWQEQCEEYKKSALQLSKQAIINCLDGRDPKEIRCLIYCSCTGMAPGPTVGDYLLRELGFKPDTKVANIVSQGCEGGGYPGLSTAVDFVIAHSKPALVVSTELCGLTYFPEPDDKPNPENDYQLLRSNAIFGEASSVALIGYDNDWRHPTVIDQESYTNTDYVDDLGYKWRDGRLMVLLNKRVPELAPLVVKPAVEAVLQRQGLEVAGIQWWVIHAAGISVIRNIQRALGISEDRLRLSLGVLRDFGNCSSATVGLVGKRLMSENIKEGDWVAIITVGPGMRGGMTIARFGV